MHDGVVLFRVEGLSQRFDLLHAQLAQHVQQLLGDHLQALPVGIVLLELADAPLQIVIHIQERLDGFGLGGGVEVFLLLGGALAVVVIFGGQTEILVVAVADQLGQGLHLLHLLTGNGEGLLRSLLLLLLRGLFLRRLALRHVLLFLLAHFSSSLGGNWFFLPNMALRLSAK